jgi:predicted TIM-barrel fold metal-dependent hydrolase
MRRIIFIPTLFVLTVNPGYGQKKSLDKKFPIIDMHLHSDYWGPPQNSYKNQKAFEDTTFAYLKRFNIVKAVTDGDFAIEYYKREPQLIIPSAFAVKKGYRESIDSLRKWFKDGTYKIMAEFRPQYDGLTPNDDELEKYFSLAEELDIPVGIHMGLGPPGAAYVGSPKYRMSDSSPLLLEDVLVKHPKMRIYIMHAGWPFINELIGLLYAHPQVYVDVAVIDWVLPKAEFYNYLRRIVEAGYGDRIMYGSDEMQWPESIKDSVENIMSADFLTQQQKEDIFYNNAAKFLRLSEQEIKKDKGNK